MERLPSFRARPALQVAGILTAFGWVFFVMAVYAAVGGSWGAATIMFITGIVAWVFAFKWYAFGASLASLSARLSPQPSYRIHTLTERRDEALRRVGELERYAAFCRREAECWPEDSLDRAELVAYASVATRQAEATVFEWREIERALRAERFEQIVSQR
jgi:hypothetical protein